MSGRGRPSRRRVIALVVALTLLLPGLGHMLIGRPWRGLIWLAGGLAVSSIAVANGVAVERSLIVTVPLTVLAMVDALLQLQGRDVPP